MAIISDAILKSLMEGGVPIMIIPESMLNQEEVIGEGFRSLIAKKKKKSSSVSVPWIPSAS
jgi:hypothetical protein